MFPHDMRCLNMSIKGIPIPPERSAIQDGHHVRSPQRQWLSRRLFFFSFLAVDVGQYAVKTSLGVTFVSSPQGDDSVPRWQATLPLFHGLCWISPRICESTEAAPCGLPVHRGIGVFGIFEGAGEQIPGKSQGNTKTTKHPEWMGLWHRDTEWYRDHLDHVYIYIFIIIYIYYAQLISRHWSCHPQVFYTCCVGGSHQRLVM